MSIFQMRRGAWGIFCVFICLFLAIGAAEDGKGFSQAEKPQFAYLFAHGLGATQQQFALFAQVPEIDLKKNQNWFLYDPVVLFNFPDAKNDKGEYLKEHVNLGQKKDIDQLHATIVAALAQLPGAGLVLTGISRGAATILNLLALAQPNYVAAVVLESPFDSFKSVINHLLKRFGVQWLPFSEKIGAKIAQSQFPSLNLDGIAPCKVASYIPQHVPILFVHSAKDKVVPVQCSRKLYIKLKETGHQHVYLLELPSGDHGKLMNSEHSLMYQNAVHAFYKKYGLPHQEDFAKHGEAFLALAQPGIAEVQARDKRALNLSDDQED
ncbi:MAG TPA: prolyl oligopeptidase family serine peptidase [Candidatus Babeliales bacterium]|nr:prolyl oligopeptidase family serine peptidase [Candidatus Babeliales bacterium]